MTQTFYFRLESAFKKIARGSRRICNTDQRLHHLRFPDDTVSFPNTTKKLTSMMEDIFTVSSRVGVQLKLGKTKFMTNQNKNTDPIKLVHDT